MSNAVLEARNISKRLDGNLVLNQINVAFFPGEIHAIIGENGAGKSSLLYILSGLFAADSGDLVMDNQPADIGCVFDAQAYGIHTIHSESGLFSNLNAYENFFLNAYGGNFHHAFRRIPHKKIHEKIVYLRNHYGLLTFDIHKPIKTLTTYQKKTLELSRAISAGARCILLDEPTLCFNQTEKTQFFGILRILKKEGVSIVFTTHDINELRQYADKVTTMRDGRVIRTVPIRKSGDIQSVVADIIGMDIKDFYPKLELTFGNELMRAESISDDTSFFDISFQLKKSEIIGFAGLKGSGKKALAECLFGVHPIKTGKLYINGKPTKFHSTEDAIRNKICYIPGDTISKGLVAQASVAQNITITNLARIYKCGCFLDAKSEEAFSNRYIRELKIKTMSAGSPVKILSPGNQKKVMLSKWLFSTTQIFILNDPVSRIDIASKVDIYNLLNELLRLGAGIMLISSDLSELTGLCDRIYVLNKGYITHEIRNRSVTDLELLHLL